MEKTLSIIKPDATTKNIIGKIINKLEEAHLKIIAARMIWLTKEQAQKFYDIHAQKSFFDELVEYMISAPVLVMVLQGENAIAQNRIIMGATDPKKAKQGTIRFEYGSSIDRNAIHGSDSSETAKREIAFFFSPEEIFSE